MIVGSLLLILVAVTLLVFGLANGSSTLLISSIAASLLAAVALVVGARQAAARTVVADDTMVDAEPYDAEPYEPSLLEDDRPGRAAKADDPQAAASAVSEAARQDTQGSPGRASGEPVQSAHLADWRVDATGIQPDAAVVAPSQRVDTPSADAVPADHSNGSRTAAGTPDGAEPPAPDDPVDEPAPQRVSPADAAQLARTTIEVLVVDGRPRYHLAGCPHLTGRDTEPVPVAEAIDLGFTPCGRCRPVDRLVVAARRA